MNLRHSNRPTQGSLWRNVHTGTEVTIVRVGRCDKTLGNEIRVLSTADKQEPGTNNGWSLEAWNEHWEPVNA